MPRRPPPDEIRLKAIGVTRLKPGEATLTFRVRAEVGVLERFERLSPQERGAVVKAGFEVLSSSQEGEDGATG
jgi:predicted transcriptional regulator